MANDLPERQNSSAMMRLLRAKAAAYDAALLVYCGQFIALAGVPVAIGVLKLILQDLPQWPTLGMLVLLGMLEIHLLDPLQRKYGGLGARLQEQFDCELFGLAWNEARNGEPPTPEEVEHWAGRQPSSRGLRDWYPVAVGRLPRLAAAVLCQRMNAEWNSRMRSRYGAILISVSIAMPLSVLVAGLLRNVPTVDTLLWVALLAWPLSSWTQRERTRQRDSVVRSQKIRARTDKLWGEVLAGSVTSSDLERSLRDLQGELYEQRKSDRQVLRRVYERWREPDERAMTRAAEDLVMQYERRFPPAGR